MSTTQQRYYDILIARVRNDRYPSHQLLDRIEHSFVNSDQVVGYLDMLLENIDACRYPSHQLLDRVERLLTAVYVA